MLDTAVSKAQVVNLNRLRSKVEESVLYPPLNIETKFKSKGVILVDEDVYTFKIMTTWIDEDA